MLKATKKSHKAKGKRDGAYDKTRGGNKPQAVYSSQCIITIVRRFGECYFCHQEKDLINNYCELCRGLCANERQCSNPKDIVVVKK